MSYIYEPQIEEDDDGYSIPKILVAVLLLVLIGAGVYIYFQQKKLKTSVTYLLDSKKQVEKELNEMIEKYNLAIDDNSDLEGNLKEERDKIIRFRDSIKNLGKDDFGELSNYQKSLSRFRASSAIQFDNPITLNSEKPIDTIADEIDESSEPETTDNQNLETRNTTNKTKPIVTNKKTKKSSDNKLVENNTEIENFKPDSTTTEDVEVNNSNTKPNSSSQDITTNTTLNETTSFNKVEVPPTYPGCRGSVTERKDCFSKKVKRHFARKFDASLVEDLSLPKGKHKVWVNFDIDKNGNIVNVKVRAPHEILEQEAVETVKQLPKMTAATQNGRNVDVNYTVPIILVSE